ncbi:MAG: universal stress protein [Saprospiraceae bacterium]|nr:universal stress protein [Saprospiraceae bacterium]
MKILLATDFSDASFNAFRYCQALSAQERMQIYVAHVYRHGTHPHLTPAQLERFYAQEYAAFEARTRRFSQQYPNLMDTQMVLRCAVEIDVTEGETSAALKRMAIEHDVDLIAIGSKTRPGLFRRLFGHLSRRLIHFQQKPLLIVPEAYHGDRPNRIALFASDQAGLEAIRTWVGKQEMFRDCRLMAFVAGAADPAKLQAAPGVEGDARPIHSRVVTEVHHQLMQSQPDLLAVLLKQEADLPGLRFQEALIHHLYDHLERPLLCLHE